MRALFLGLVLLSAPAAGQSISTATAGDTIWTTSPISSSSQEIVLEEAAKGGGFFSTSGTATAQAGEVLEYVETKQGRKACSRNMSSAIVDHARACFVDSDSDGYFDQYSYKENATLAALKKPAKYSVRTNTNQIEPSLVEKVIYLGANGSTLNLSYREFKDNLARPAFTEELTIPLAAAYPQRVRFKGIEMEILGIDGMGMRYAITTPQPVLTTQNGG